MDTSSSALGKFPSSQVIEMATPHFLLAPSVPFLEEFYKMSYFIGMVLGNMPNIILQLISWVRESIMFKIRYFSSEDIRP